MTGSWVVYKASPKTSLSSGSCDEPREEAGPPFLSEEETSPGTEESCQGHSSGLVPAWAAWSCLAPEVKAKAQAKGRELGGHLPSHPHPPALGSGSGPTAPLLRVAPTP